MFYDHPGHDIAHDHYLNGVGAPTFPKKATNCGYLFLTFKLRRYNLSKELVLHHVEQVWDAHSLARFVYNLHALSMLFHLCHAGVYWQEPLPTDIADRVNASFPNNLLRLLHRRVANEIAEADKYIYVMRLIKRRFIRTSQGTSRGPESERIPFEFRQR